MDGSADDDAALMLAYAAGDTAAFRTLYARHRGPLYRFILHRVGQRAVADDLFQETWSRVVAARTSWQPNAKFATWLLRIAHNAIIDHHRRGRPQAGAEETERVFAHEAIPEREHPDAALSEFEQRRRLQRALETLSDEQRTVFLLRAEQALSLEEIAAITETGRETVKSRLRYALAHIRHRLSE